MLYAWLVFTNLSYLWPDCNIRVPTRVMDCRASGMSVLAMVLRIFLCLDAIVFTVPAEYARIIFWGTGILSFRYCTIRFIPSKRCWIFLVYCGLDMFCIYAQSNSFVVCFSRHVLVGSGFELASRWHGKKFESHNHWTGFYSCTKLTDWGPRCSVLSKVGDSGRYGSVRNLWRSCIRSILFSLILHSRSFHCFFSSWCCEVANIKTEPFGAMLIVVQNGSKTVTT